MRKFNYRKKEKGAITMLTAVILTVLIGFTALTIDIGLHYYRGAKLQNALDAAATAVGATLGSTDNSMEDNLYIYLKKNGYDKAEYQDDMSVSIERKGVLNELSITDEDDYISTGYYKITVELDDKTSFARIFNIDSLHLKKTAFVKCSANYTEMPKALKYTIFGGSTKGTDQDATVSINGRTGATVNEITAAFENIINKTNSKIVQPIIGIFGGTPDYNKLVHINLSETITDGDVHSNSNISIGVQALNASRMKDYDYDGEESNNDAYDETTKANDNTPEDYGQVTYTAVTDILFNSSLKANRDESTHIYVQNQQYIEQTQAALNILNTIDNFNSITSLDTLQRAYLNAADEYLSNKPNITDDQKKAIRAQSENLVYNSDGTFSFNNQSIIVYDVSQQHAEEMLASARELGIDGLVDELNSAKIDQLYSSGTSNLLYSNTADTGNSFSYGVLFTKKNAGDDAQFSKQLIVNGTQVSRDTTNIYQGVEGITMNNSTQTGMKFAVARTFLQNSEYIDVPNMKPYFIRQVNTSIRQATKTAAEMGDSEVLGDRTVKEAVKHMGNDLASFLETESYTDDKYSTAESVTSKDKSPLFTNYKASRESGLTPLTDDAHTSYKGYSLYDSNDNLRGPEYFINLFKANNFAQNNNDEATFGSGAVRKAYNDLIANNTSTKDKYPTNYSEDAVNKKKDSLGTFDTGYDVKKNTLEADNSIKSVENVGGKKTDVFLGPDVSEFESLGISGDAYTVREEFNSLSDFDKTVINSGASRLATYSIASGIANVTINTPACWASGATGTKSISTKASSGTENLTGKYFDAGNTVKNKSVVLCASSSDDAIALVVTDLSVEKSGVFGSEKNLDIGNSGDTTGAPATLVVTGNVTVSNQLQVRSGSVLICHGSVTCKSLLMEAGARIYCANLTVSEDSSLGDNTQIVCQGTCEFKSNSFTNSATSSVTANSISLSGKKTENLTINGALRSNSAMTLNPRILLSATGNITCLGNLTLNGDKDYASLDNSGTVCVKGNLTSPFKITCAGGDMFVVGSVSAYNSSSNEYSGYGHALKITNDSRVYIGGTFGTTSSSHRRIYINGGENAVFSVFGNIDDATNTSAITLLPSIDEFCNSQPSGKVYFGVGLSPATRGIYCDAGNTFMSKGSMYVYGGLQLTTGAVELSSSGTTYIQGTFYAASADVTLTDGHRLIVANEAVAGVRNTVNIKSLSVSGGSKAWILAKLITPKLVVDSADSSNISEIFCGEGSTLGNGNATSLDINGRLYVPFISFFPINRLNVGQYGMYIYNGDARISDYFYISQGGTVYIDGKTTISNCAISNYGNMYMVGGVDLTSSNTTTTDCSIYLGNNSDSFIGKNSDGNLTLKGYYSGHGNVYIDNNLVINGYNKADKNDKNYVYNRGEAILVTENTYVSGDINCTYDGNGAYIDANSSLSCKNLTITSSIYSVGTTVILENLNYVHGSYYSDKGDDKYEQGYCLLIGGKSHNANSLMYIGGSNPLTFNGVVENWGQLYTNGAMTVNGYSITSDRMHFGSRPTRKDGEQTDYAPHFSIINGNNAKIQLSGNVSASCGIYNYPYSTFATDGDVKYGMAILNGGNFVAGGNVGYSDNCWKINHIEVFADDVEILVGANKKGSYSIVNGFVDNASDSQYNRNAIFYAGGTLTIGTKENYTSSETDKVGGTLQNWGKVYIDGGLNVFANKEYSYNISSIICQAGSDTFIKGNCFSSSVTAIMDNSIFMCGGDYQSKRASKINIDEEFQNDDDKFTPCYVYVGGNMLVNTSGLSSDSSTNANTTRKLDIYSNSNIFVAGSLYANCELNIKQNVNLIVCGQKKLNSNDSIDAIINSITNGTIKQTIRGLIDGTDYKLFGYQHLVVEPCSKIIVHGSTYIRDTSKIRDMTKTYIYGEFKCGDYVEIGKALDGKDETEAKEDLYKAEGENDTKYKFSNAAYMYVGGDFYCSGYNKIYASSTLRVKEDYTSNKYLTLRHDAKIVVGKKLKAATSIDVGSYSTMFVGGSVQATTSTIKIRDCTNVFVGGNMTALSYIELGKAGDFVRDYVPDISEGEDNLYDEEQEHEKTHNKVKCPSCSTNIQYNNQTVTYIKCDNDECNKYVKAIVACPNCGTNNYYAGENFSCQNCGAEGYFNDASAVTCDNCSTVNPLVIDVNVEGQHIYRPFYIKCTNGKCGVTFDPYLDVDADGDSGESTSDPNATTEDTQAELAGDTSDTALGGTFYIGKKLVSYTGYIKEFAYSRVAVGEYVFTPKYVTLRHNADLWIMPETFNNSTYQKKAYVSISDGSLLGDILDAVRKFGYELSQTFSPKAGSLYTLGELTLNKNASLMGTYDCIILGQCVLRQDSLVYMGHDFNCSAPSANISLDSIKGNTSVVGFDSYGTSSGNGVTFPVVVYANNEINISTTTSMRLTYLVANKGDVNLYDIYSKSDNAENNAKQLPNAVCSYLGDVNYFAMYGKIGALFYAPNGNVDLDGYYMEIWGSCIGDTVDVNTYYLALHRFTNWRTMDLHIAQSGNVFLVSENEYEHASDNVDDIYMTDSITNPDLPEGAQIFF